MAAPDTRRDGHGAVALPDLIRLAARHLEERGEPLLPHERMLELT
jgi:hypothetical protein